MLESLRALIDAVLRPSPANDATATEHALQLATAVMLVEVMRADARFEPSERVAVWAALRERFALSPAEAEQLAELAITTARDATDLYAYTSRINAGFDMPQKVLMVEHLWRVAYADGHLGEHERHLLWRIADLLHVPQGAYVHARMRVQAEREAPGGDRP